MALRLGAALGCRVLPAMAFALALGFFATTYVLGSAPFSPWAPAPAPGGGAARLGALAPDGGGSRAGAAARRGARPDDRHHTHDRISSALEFAGEDMPEAESRFAAAAIEDGVAMLLRVDPHVALRSRSPCAVPWRSIAAAHARGRSFRRSCPAGAGAGSGQRGAPTRSAREAPRPSARPPRRARIPRAGRIRGGRGGTGHRPPRGRGRSAAGPGRDVRSPRRPRRWGRGRAQRRADQPDRGWRSAHPAQAERRRARSRAGAGGTGQSGAEANAGQEKKPRLPRRRPPQGGPDAGARRQEALESSGTPSGAARAGGTVWPRWATRARARSAPPSASPPATRQTSPWTTTRTRASSAAA